MTVKPVLFLLFFSTLGLWAQTVPAPSVPPSSEEPLAARRRAILVGRTNLPPAVRPQGPPAAAGANTPAANPALPPPLPPPLPTAGANAQSIPPAAATPAPASVAAPGTAPAPGAAGATPAAARTAPATAATGATGTTNAPADDVLAPGMINFQQADLSQVLTIYAELVNRTILRGSGLNEQTKISLKTQTPLTRREAVQALDAVLGMNGITMINVGDKFVKAAMEAQGNQMGAAFSQIDATNMPDLGPYVTHVVQLTYARPSEMVAVLTPFQKLPQAILAIDSSQILVLRDYSENVKRMLELVKKVDVAIPSEFAEEVIPIKYALASDIAGALNSLSSGGGGATVGSSGGSGGSGGGGGRSLTGSRTGSMGRSGVGGMGGMGGYPGSMGGMNSPFGTQGATTAGQPAGSSFGDRLRNIINKAATSGEIQVIGQTKIIADERTNSLLIFASKEDMKMIKDIIAKLDIVLAQVLIETVIFEVNLNTSRNLGVSYLERQTHGIGNYFNGIGAVDTGNRLSLSDFVMSNGTNSNGSTAGGFRYLGMFGSDLDVTVTALASDSRAKILQRPRIQTSNAKQATLFVGESRPYPTGSYYGGGSYGGYSSIQQMQIGVQIDVTPLINPDGLVVMDIHQKIDSVSGTVNVANVGDVPITSSKEAQASVAVRDHDTIILGGLIETSKSKSGSGVPYLMNIPLLGYLFRSTAEKEVRNELIVLIRPTVLPTPEVAALTARAEKNNMPGVRKAEREIGAAEAKRLKQMDKEAMKGE